MRRVFVALICLVAASWAAAAAAETSPVSIMKLMAPGPLPEMALGQPTAPVTIVEYASMTCPHCGRSFRETFPTLKTKYIDTGKVYFVFREFPLDQLAFAASMAARCAPADKSFPIIDTLFQQQDSWAYVDKPAPALVAQLEPFGFTQDSFAACLQKQDIYNGINTIAETAQKEFGVDATPTFFIDGVKHVGEMNVAEMEAILDPLVAKAAN